MSRIPQDAGLYDALIMEYTCGALDRALSLLIASHITLSPAARRRASLFESLGGTLMDTQCEPVAMQAHSLHAVLGRLSGDCGGAPCPPQDDVDNLYGFHSKMPQSLCATLRNCCERTRPRWRHVTPGIAVMPMPIPCGEHNRQAFMVRAKPGAHVRRAAHQATEFTLVLEGGFHDEAGCYGRGDLVILEAGVRHRPVADARQGCLSLVVTEEQMGIPRWLAAFLRLP